MARDQWNRNIGDNIPVKDMAKQMLSDVKTVHETPKDENKDTAIDRLYEAVNNFAMQVDANATRDFNQAKEWSKTLFDFANTFKKTAKNDKQEEKTEDTQTVHLSKIAEATGELWRSSQGHSTFWVGISKISKEAQKDIADAIKLAGCCGESVAKAIDPNIHSASISSDVNAASKKALNNNVIINNLGLGNTNGQNNTTTPRNNTGSGNRNNGIGGGGGNGGSGAGGGSPGGSGSPLNSVQLAGRWFAIASALQIAAGVLERVHGRMVASLDINLSKMFSGAITSSMQFKESLRKIVHEQQGFGATNREVENQYRDMTNHMLASGIDRARYQKIYLENLERGLPLATAEDKLSVKNLKSNKQELALIKARTERMQSIQTTALNTAYSLHMSAESTNELFMGWQMHLGLSEASLGEMGRHMQGIARNSGVTGAQLETAMKNADGVMKNLKKAGVASVDAMKNVTEFMAAAQKHGFEGASEMMNALANRQSFLESKQRLFLVNSARESGDPNAVRDLVMGKTLQTPDGMKNLMKGQESFVRKIFSNFQGQLSGIGVDASEIDVSNLSEIIQKLQSGDDAQIQAAAALQRQFEFLGTSIGEAEQSFKAMQESSLKPYERINKYQADLAKMALDGLGQTDEYRRLQEKLNQTSTDLSMDALSKMNSFATRIQESGGKIGGQLEKDLVKNLTNTFGSEQEASKWLKNLTNNTEKAVQDVNQRAKSAGMNLDSLLKKRGVSGQGELQKLLREGNIKGMRVLQESMQEIAKEENQNQDPVTDIRNTLDDISKNIGKIVDSLSFGLSDIATQILYFGGYIGGFLLDLLSIFATGQGFATLASGTGMLAGVGNSVRTAGANVAGAANRVGGAGARTIGPYLGPIAGAVTAAVMLAYGGMKGYSEGKEEAYKGKDAKFTALEGMLYGALTGGAKTGSFMSSTLGVDKGSAVDKTLGVVGSAGWGAIIGTSLAVALAPITGGLSLAAGALIGAVVGGSSEIFKILTEGSQVIQKYLFDPIMMILGMIGDVIGGVWKILTGIITFDFNRIGSGFHQIFVGIFDGIKNLIQRAIEGLLSLVFDIPGMLFRMIKSAFLDFPNWIVESITGALKSLASNEYIGAIFEPILEVWNILKDTWGEIYKTFAPVFDAINTMFLDLKNAMWSLISPLFEATEGSSIFKGSIQLLSWTIGWIIRIALLPLRGVLNLLAIGVNVLLAPIKFLIQGLKILKDGVVELFNYIKEATGNAISYVINLPFVVAESMYNLGDSIISGLWQKLGELPTIMWDTFTAIFLDLPIFLFNSITGGLISLGTWIYDNTIGALLKAMPSGLKYVLGIKDTDVKKETAVASNTLKNSETTTALKNSINEKKIVQTQVSPALTGAFERDQAREALNIQNELKNISIVEYEQSYRSLREASQNRLKESSPKEVSMAYTGAFDPTESRSALDVDLYDRKSSADYKLVSLQDSFQDSRSLKGQAGYQGLGLFDPNQPDEAQDGSTENMVNRIYGVSNADLNNIASSRFDKKKNQFVKEKNIIAEASQSLNYDTTASDAATQTDSLYLNGSSNSQVNTNLLDYRDDLKGEVGMLAMNRVSMERSVAQDKYGSQPSGSTSMVNMDEIAAYLINTQSMKLDTMIEILSGIRTNTGGSGYGGSTIVGPQSGDPQLVSRPGIKNISKDSSRGFWDYTYGDYSTGAVTTEGRGGSA